MSIKPCVLIVDDEEANRSLLAEMVKRLGYSTETAQDGIEALAKIKLGIDLVLLDIRMPGMDGVEVVRRIRRDPANRDIPICMVTGETRRETRLQAIEDGANDYITKPVDVTELEVRIGALMRTKRALDELRRNQAELETTVEKRTTALRQALDEMVDAQRRTYQAYLDTLQRLALAAEYKDEDTASHIHRMSLYCALLAEELGLPPGEVEILRHASPMHDVGKMGIPDAILLKPGKLTEEEWTVMKKHSTIGARILSGTTSGLLHTGEIIALTHHEKWNGKGYPGGLAEEAIPLMGRICAVADVFDALTTRRPYKVALENEKAFEIIGEGKGAHFDPQVVGVFFSSIDKILAIQKQHSETTATLEQ